MGWKVFISRRIPQVGIDLLKSNGLIVDVYEQAQVIPRQELLNRIGEYDALLSVLTEEVNEELLNVAPSLKIVANYAVGYNNIDVTACTKRKIAVTNTPDVLTEATADLTLTLILSVAKRIIEGDTMVRNGEFSGWDPLMLLGSDVSGKTLGIVGAGRIGTAVIERAAGFNMEIIYFDTNVNEHIEAKCKARKASLDEIFSQSDFVSLHVPLTEQTHHLVNRQRLEQMKQTAFLINTSRGPVVDEQALFSSLKQKQIGGAGLDVFENEPEIIPGLLEQTNTVLLPHIGSATVKTRDQMARLAANNIIKMYRNEVPDNILNPQIFNTG